MDVTVQQSFITLALPAHVTASAVNSGVERFLELLAPSAEKGPLAQGDADPACGEPACTEPCRSAESAVQTVVVDARSLTRMDGAVLRFLTALKAHCEAARLHFQLVNPSPDLHPFLQLFRLI